MKTEIFIHRSRIEAPAAEVYAWHALPDALEQLTPPGEHIEVIERMGGIERGARVVLRFGRWPFRRRWVAVHQDFEEGRYFSDVQVSGPFAYWKHTHTFEPDDPTSCTLEDKVEYALPFGFLGRWLAGSFVRRKLEKMFEHRHKVTARLIAAERSKRPDKNRSRKFRNTSHVSIDEVTHPGDHGLYNRDSMSTQQRTPVADLSSLRIHDRARKPTGRGKRLGWLAGGLLVILVGAAAAYRFKDPKTVVEVTAARSAANSPAQALLNASGYVTPRRRSSVAAKITGKVIEVDTDEGMHVKEGQVIARLDCSESDAALASAKADRIATEASIHDLEVNLANADRELKRTQQLTDAGVSTPQALDAARTLADSYRARISLTKEQVGAADRKIDVAQENVNNCTIRAPFTGQVVSKDAQVGEMVSPISAGGGFTRTGIATIVDMQSNEIEVDVNESYIARVKERQKVTATLDAYPNWQIPSHVRTIIPTADRQKATVKVRVTFDKLDPRILPDMGVKVAFLGEEQPRPTQGGGAATPKALIPSSAVRQQDGKATVFLVHDGKVERRAVTLGSQRGEDVEVLAGVSEGDTLVAKVPENLRDGQIVELKQ